MVFYKGNIPWNKEGKASECPNTPADESISNGDISSTEGGNPLAVSNHSGTQGVSQAAGRGRYLRPPRNVYEAAKSKDDLFSVPSVLRPKEYGCSEQIDDMIDENCENIIVNLSKLSDLMALCL